MTESRRNERGSALIMAVFVLALVASMGMALLFLGQLEVRMSKTGLQEKKSFFLAEAGVEDGRGSLYDINKGEDFSDDLTTSAGPDGNHMVDPSAIRPVYDAAGNLTGFTGYGDDVPLTNTTAFGEGWYMVLLANDPLEQATPTLDQNHRVMMTGVGAGPDSSFEVVQAIVEKDEILPQIPPATILLLGPDPAFQSGSSNPKEYVGDDCNGLGGMPGLYGPVVGTVDTVVDEGIERPKNFMTGGLEGYDTVADVTDADALDAMGAGLGPLDPSWTDCAFLQQMVESIREVADVVCEPPAPCTPPPPSPSRVMMVDGDYTVGGDESGQGLLLVTGTLEMHGRASWRGLILVIGEGKFDRFGAGNGVISGSLVVADIAGPDDIYGTADDCSGGVEGFDTAAFDEKGGGNGDTVFCTDDIVPAIPIPPYKVVSFVQH